MIIEFFHTFFYNPIYNLLVFFVDVIPFGDVGISIILTTLLVKIILVPVSISALKTQRAMKELQPKMKEIQEMYKDNREEQGRRILALYKEYNVKPFSSIIVFILQIPVVIALYYVFSEDPFPAINMDILYSFMSVPTTINLNFLGFFDVTGKSIALALLAGITQFFSIRFMLDARKTGLTDVKEIPEKPSMKTELMKNMETQMKYVMPVIIVFVAYAISSAIALYLITSNLFTLGQEIALRKKK